MRVYLVQHGEAQPEAVSAERELTPRGRSDVERVANLLAGGGVRVAKVCHSGKTRARQTAEPPLVDYRPGAVACVERDAGNRWVLAWMVRPELLAGGSPA
jgi:broad specificity phosphatase PhoE